MALKILSKQEKKAQEAAYGGAAANGKHATFMAEQNYSCLPDSPAFPVPPGMSADDPYGGLTKREYFAAEALKVLGSQEQYQTMSELVADAVLTADLLIDVLNVKGRV